MKIKTLLCIGLIFQLSACHGSEISRSQLARAQKAINLCVMQVHEAMHTDVPAAVDRAYTFIKERNIYVTFEHGESGFFGKISKSGGGYIVCDVAEGSTPEVVYLGRPLQWPVIQKRKNLGTAAGSIQALFKRQDGKFKFVRAQPFDVQNFYRHNPDYKPSVD